MSEVQKPMARHDDLVVTAAGEDRLVYDTRVHVLHHLNRVTWEVWTRCDGRLAVEDVRLESELALGTEVSNTAVDAALGLLAGAGLLETSPVVPELRMAQSRRRLLRRAGVAGAVAIPALTSVSAPAGAHHQSGRCHLQGETCVVHEDCCQDPPWGARFCVRNRVTNVFSCQVENPV